MTISCYNLVVIIKIFIYFKEPSRIATYSRHKHKYDRNTLKEKHTELMRYERAKLESDRNFITQGMEDTLADLNQSQTFTPMQAYLR